MEVVLRGQPQCCRARGRAGETPPEPHVENDRRCAEIARGDGMQPGMLDQAADGRAVAVGVGEMADNQGLAGAPLGLRLLRRPEWGSPALCVTSGAGEAGCPSMRSAVTAGFPCPNAS